MQNDKNRNLFYSIYNFISIDRPMKTVLKHQTGFNMVIVVNQSCLLAFLTMYNIGLWRSIKETKLPVFSPKKINSRFNFLTNYSNKEEWCRFLKRLEVKMFIPILPFFKNFGCPISKV